MSRSPVDYIERTREQYGSLGYPPYQWVHNEDEPPFATVSKPLAESRIGLIASGGVYREGQIAFHYRDDTDRKNNPPIDIVAGVLAWSLSGSMSVQEQPGRGRNAAIWSRQSRKHVAKTGWVEGRRKRGATGP